MNILNTKSLECNKKFKINFNGGDLSSDAGALLLKEFICKVGFDKLFKRIFKTNDTSQPTLSRFFNRMDNDTLKQFYQLQREMRKIVYDIKNPDIVILYLDSTLLDTYGHQEGEGFNFHYQNHGYHPLVCFDGMTGDLLKIELRDGTAYSSTGVVDFLQPILDEFLEDYWNTSLVLRGDSGFATPELYKQCETNGTSYVIRLKENNILRSYASYADNILSEKTRLNQVDYAVEYGEFYYQASSWDYPRRVVFKVEKPANQIIHMYTFIVTNMDGTPEDLIKFYCKRGTMENYIKESKNGFDFAAVSSHSKIVNANRVQIHALAYNIFNWFKRLVLPNKMKKHTIDTIRIKLLKIAVKVVRSARYLTFKLCSSCPYKDEFYKTLENIQHLQPMLA